jgi:hypothetical protein
MEVTETNDQIVPEAPDGIVLTPEAQIYLREAGKWANFLGIIGFIVCALFLILALFIGALFSVMAKLSPIYSQLPAAMGTVLSVIFILIDILYFFFALYLYQFGSRIKNGLMYMDANQVADALGKLKSFFKLAGIVTIVVLCIYALEIIGVVLVGIASGGR